MMLLALVGPVCLLLVAVGVRVLSLRDVGVTERAIGIAFFAMGAGAIPALFSGNPLIVPEAWARVAFAAGQLLFSVAFAAFYLFTWRCFGADSAWRKALAIAGIGAQVAVWGSLAVVEGFAPSGGGTLRIAALTRCLVIVWAFCESLHCWRMMRRRQTLGLVDPVVTNRFALWAGWTGSLMGTMAIALGIRVFAPDLLLDPSVPGHLAMLVWSVGCVAASCACLALAFFPPAAYVARVRARAGA